MERTLLSIAILASSMSLAAADKATPNQTDQAQQGYGDFPKDPLHKQQWNMRQMAIENVESQACSWTDAKSRRIARINAVLRSQHFRTNAWRISWGMGFGMLGAAQASLATASEEELADFNQTKETMYWGAGRSILASAGMAVIPVHVDDGTFPMTCSGLERAEKALAMAAKRQQKGRSWSKQVATVGVNLAVTLGLGLGHGQWREGLVSGAVGLAVGEASIFTQPTGAIDLYQEVHSQQPSPQWLITPQVTDDYIGLGVAVFH